MTQKPNPISKMQAGSQAFVRRHWMLILAVLAVLLLVLWFAMGALDKARNLRQTAAPEPLEAWMTLRFAARSYGLPAPEVERALNLDLEGKRRRNLGQIAEETGLSLEEIEARFQEIAAQRHAEREAAREIASETSQRD